MPHESAGRVLSPPPQSPAPRPHRTLRLPSSLRSRGSLSPAVKPASTGSTTPQATKALTVSRTTLGIISDRVRTRLGQTMRPPRSKPTWRELFSDESGGELGRHVPDAYTFDEHTERASWPLVIGMWIVAPIAAWLIVAAVAFGVYELVTAVWP